MPRRQLPRTNNDRLTAFRSANAKNAATPPVDSPLTAGTQTALAATLPVYNDLIKTANTARSAQLAATEAVAPLLRSARLWVSHGYQALINACVREEFSRSVLAFYGLASTATANPDLASEQDVMNAGAAFAQGETDRVAAGGDPITFPLPATIATKVAALGTAHQAQSALKTAYDDAQEAIAAKNPDADKLILKLWNEVETAFDTGDKASMRRRAREWGVVYVPSPGEAPSPDEYSMMGKVTSAANGAPLPDVLLSIDGLGLSVTTDAEGRYYFATMPPGTYTIKVTLTGYQPQEPSATVVAGTITELDVALTPE